MADDHSIGWTIKRLDKLYFYTGTKIPLTLHKLDCESRGMKMVKIRDMEENWFIRSHARRKFNLRLGAEWNTTIKTLQWIGDQSKLNDGFTFFQDGPSHCTDPNGCCEVIMRHTGGWVIANCSNNHHDYAICEKSLKAAPLPGLSIQSTILTTPSPKLEKVLDCAGAEEDEDYPEDEIVTEEVSNDEGSSNDYSVYLWLLTILNTLLNIVLIILLIYTLKVTIRRRDMVPIGWKTPTYDMSDM